MSWVHLEDTRPVARKAYECYLCERPIAEGERHVKRAGVDEDGRGSFRMHAACEAKTREWDEHSWMCHDAGEFRHYELEEGGGA